MLRKTLWILAVLVLVSTIIGKSPTIFEKPQSQETLKDAKQTDPLNTDEDQRQLEVVDAKLSEPVQSQPDWETTEQVTTEQVTTGQVTTGQVTIEQVTSDQVISDSVIIGSSDQSGLSELSIFKSDDIDDDLYAFML